MDFEKQFKRLLNEAKLSKVSRESILKDDRVIMNVNPDDRYISVKLKDVKAYMQDNANGHIEVYEIHIYEDTAYFFNRYNDRFKYDITNKFIKIADEDISAENELQIKISICDFPEFLNKLDLSYMDFPIFSFDIKSSAQDININGYQAEILAYLNPCMLTPVCIGKITESSIISVLNKMGYLMSKISNNLLGFYNDCYFILEHKIYHIVEFDQYNVLAEDIIENKKVVIPYYTLLVGDNVTLLDEMTVVMKAVDKDMFEFIHVSEYAQDELDISPNEFLNKFIELYRVIPSMSLLDNLIEDHENYSCGDEEYLNRIKDCSKRIVATVETYRELSENCDIHIVLIDSASKIQIFDNVTMQTLVDIYNTLELLIRQNTPPIPANEESEESSEDANTSCENNDNSIDG